MTVRNKWRLRLLSLTLGVVAAIVLAELGLRLLGVGYPQLYQPDLHCGSRLRPATRGVWTSEVMSLLVY